MICINRFRCGIPSLLPGVYFHITKGVQKDDSVASTTINKEEMPLDGFRMKIFVYSSSVKTSLLECQ